MGYIETYLHKRLTHGTSNTANVARADAANILRMNGAAAAVNPQQRDASNISLRTHTRGFENCVYVCVFVFVGLCVWGHGSTECSFAKWVCVVVLRWNVNFGAHATTTKCNQWPVQGELLWQTHMSMLYLHYIHKKNSAFQSEEINQLGRSHFPTSSSSFMYVVPT